MAPHYVRLLRMIRAGLYFHVGEQPVYKSYSYIDNNVHQMASLAEADAAAIQRRTFYLADSKPIELRAWCNQFAQRFETRIPTIPLAAAKAMASCGDILHAVGWKRFPFTSRRLRNVRASYLFDTRPIEAVAGPSQVGIDDGVRKTAKWVQEIDG